RALRQRRRSGRARRRRLPGGARAATLRPREPPGPAQPGRAHRRRGDRRTRRGRADRGAGARRAPEALAVSAPPAARREVSGEPRSEERGFEEGLRPRTLDEMVGQEKLRENLAVFIAAAWRR